MRRILILTAVSMVMGYAAAQPVLKADRTKVVIGDQVLLTMTTPLPGDQQWINQSDFWPDTLTAVEIASDIDCHTESSQHICAWRVSVFDTGLVRIPSLPIILQSGGKKDTFWTIDIPIEVEGVEPDSSGLIGIQDIYAEPFQLDYYLRYLPYVIGCIALLVAGWWWMTRRRKETKPEGPVVESLPHEWALAELEALSEQGLWQSGEIKEHYSRLTGVFRGYLEKRYAIRALEQTTDEITRQLTVLDLDTDIQQRVIELLSMADMVKFAKADPGIDIHSRAIDQVRDFILATIPVTTSDADGTDMA